MPARELRAAGNRLLTDRRIRYLLAGAASSAIYYAIFSTGWLGAGGKIPYLLLATGANAATAVLSYPFYRKGVFQHEGPWLSGLLRFYVVCLWALIFSLVGLPLLVEVVHIPVLIAQAIIIVAAPLINYQLHKIWAFRHRVAPRTGP